MEGPVDIKDEGLEYFRNKLGVSEDEMEYFMNDNLRHMEFQKESITMKIFNSMRKMM